MTDMNDPYQWRGRTMFGSDGEKIGRISDIYDDPETGRPEWATVSTGLFGTRSNFVPLAGAGSDGDDVRADVTKAQVKDAPGVENDDELSEHEERRLFRYYGLAYPEAGSRDDEVRRGDGVREDTHRGRDEAAGRDDAGRGGAPGGPRLRRYVVTERVIVEVPEAAGEAGSRDRARDERGGDPLHGELAGDTPTRDDRVSAPRSRP